MARKVKQPIKPKPKKEPKPKKDDIKQGQQQTQNVIVNVADIKKAKPRKKRAPRRKPEEVQMYREFPKVVYIPPPLTIYGDRLPEDTRPSITKPTEPPKKTPILEDIGSIGTEGAVQILDVPTKKEQLSELITPVALPAEDSGRAIARSMVEPEKERMRLPDDSVNRLMPSKKSDSETTFGFPSDKSISSVSNVSSEKSFRFPEPTTFRYSDVEKLGPSPYASEISVGSGGFSGSESDAPSRFSGNVFMEQQAGFMRYAQKQYKEKQQKPESNAKMRIEFPEEGGYLTGVTQPTKKPKRSSKKSRVVDTGGEDVLFGLPPSTEFSGKIPKQVFKEVAPFKPLSKMNKTELENAYKRFSGGQTPPNMSKKDLYREVSGMVAR